jgi:hypothetical protein
MPKRATTLPEVDDRIIDRAFDQAELILKSTDRLAHSKYEGLGTLDEFNDIMVAMGTAMFQLGVKHGARKA